MEPRPHERGNPLVGFTDANPNAASMEPRPHERGNGVVYSQFNTSAAASMEPRPHERGNHCPRMAFSTMTARFNGATSSRTWKRPSFKSNYLAYLPGLWRVGEPNRQDIGGTANFGQAKGLIHLGFLVASGDRGKQHRYTARKNVEELRASYDDGHSVQLQRPCAAKCFDSFIALAIRGA